MIVDHQYEPCFVCKAPADDIHHEPRRGQGGSKKWRGTLIALCRQCHHDRHEGNLRFDVTITYRRTR